MQALFGSSAIGSDEWLLILGVSVVIYAAIGLEKLIFRRVGRRR
jgi:Ca2+-transporting ATPase